MSNQSANLYCVTAHKATAVVSSVCGVHGGHHFLFLCFYFTIIPYILKFFLQYMITINFNEILIS